MIIIVFCWLKHEPLCLFYLKSSDTDHFWRSLKFRVLENSDLENSDLRKLRPRKLRPLVKWVRFTLSSTWCCYTNLCNIIGTWSLACIMGTCRSICCINVEKVIYTCCDINVGNIKGTWVLAGMIEDIIIIVKECCCFSNSGWHKRGMHGILAMIFDHFFLCAVDGVVTSQNGEQVTCAEEDSCKGAVHDHALIIKRTVG